MGSARDCPLGEQQGLEQAQEQADRVHVSCRREAAPFPHSRPSAKSGI